MAYEVLLVTPDVPLLAGPPPRVETVLGSGRSCGIAR